MRRSIFVFFVVCVLLGSVVAAQEVLQAGQTEVVSLDQTPAELSQDTTLKDFPRDLGRNFENLFSLQNSSAFLNAAYASGFAAGLDGSVNSYFSGHDRLGKADNVGAFLGSSTFMAGATGSLLLAAQFSHDDRFRRMSYSMAQGYVITNVLTTGIKYSVQRRRPDHSNDLSFLSGHTSNTFMAATVLHHYYGPKVGTVAYLTAAFVGLSRVERNVHYLSDVIAGAGLGTIVGRTVVTGPPVSSRRWLLTPATNADGHGAGLNLTIQW